MPEVLGRPDVDLLQELYSTGLLVELLVDEELAKVDVPDRALLVHRLGDAPRARHAGALSAETGLPPTTVRDYVRRLVASGDARKVPNPADGRSYHLVLTAKGRGSRTAAGPQCWLRLERVERHLARPAGEHIATMRELRQAVRLALAESEARPRRPAAQAESSTR